MLRQREIVLESSSLLLGHVSSKAERSIAASAAIEEARDHDEE